MISLAKELALDVQPTVVDVLNKFKSIKKSPDEVYSKITSVDDVDYYLRTSSVVDIDADPTKFKVVVSVKNQGKLFIVPITGNTASLDF